MGQPINPAPATPPAPGTGPAPTNPTPPAPAPAAPAPPPAEKTFTQADLDRIIGERLAKTSQELAAAQAKAKQWEEFENAAKPEQQKAQEAALKAAEEAAYAKARGDFGGQLVEAHITAAAAGRLSEQQRQALLLGLDRSRFLKQDGTVDTGAITTLIDGLAPSAPASPTPGTPPVPGGFGQGARPGSPVGGLAAGAAAYEASKQQTAPLFS